jgi:putative transposase
MPDFRRKPNRLAWPSYLGFGEYFLTFCTGGRKRFFAAATENEELKKWGRKEEAKEKEWRRKVAATAETRGLVDVLLAALRQTCAAHKFAAYAYCFMPDHLHLLAQAQSKECRLPAFVKAFKGGGTAAVRPLGIHQLWQKGFYDHVIRDSESAGEIAWYILSNPVRAGLTRTVWDWPYSGSLVFDWKRLPPSGENYVPPWKKSS